MPPFVPRSTTGSCPQPRPRSQIEVEVGARADNWRKGILTVIGNELGWPTWIGVVCEDLERQRGFYRDTLGLRETGAGPGWVLFDMGGNLLEVIQRDESAQYDAARYQVG